MALNFVTVTGTFYAASPVGTQPAAGSILFTPSDLIWNTSSTYVGVMAPVGGNFNASGQLSNINLLAMDNAGLSGNWYWQCVVTIAGVAYPRRKLTVNYSAGASQDISVLLNASTVD